MTAAADLSQAHPAGGDLQRELGAWDLVLLGVGCIIGAGIFVLTGMAAALYAGPAIILSFIFAGIAAAFAGFCYAELAATMPVSGSAYSYAQRALGEVPAWALGWLLLLEYGVAASYVAVGLSSYLVSLLQDLGLVLPEVWTTSAVQLVMRSRGLTYHLGGSINLLAIGLVMAVAALHVGGLRKSLVANRVMVAVKLVALLIFIAFGISAVQVSNWVPFIPPNSGNDSYGWPGILRASSIVFVAYLGFESISTAGGESRNPQRDLPIGILGALSLCTILYMAVAAVMTGIVPYAQLGVADPVALAVDAVGIPALSWVVKIGAVMGLSSVLLIVVYAQSRIAYAIALDGLLPPIFAKIDRRTHVPKWGIIILASVAALASGLLPISSLADMVSLGTASAFAMVALCVIRLRNSEPDRPRSFRVPLGGVRLFGIWIGVTPFLAFVGAVAMMIPTLRGMWRSAADGQGLVPNVLGGYLLAGAILYLAYGRGNARCRAARALAAELPAHG